MNANELRIGNYISPLGKGVTIVEGFCTWDGLIQSSSFAERSIEDFEPIKITEEWLLKLGLFKITKKEDLWDNDEIGVYDFKGKIRIDDFFITSNDLTDFTFYVATIDDGMESYQYLNNIIYVHQLQNLYFALTGEELTVEL